MIVMMTSLLLMMEIDHRMTATQLVLVMMVMWWSIVWR
jgi:hypothetical protein